MSCILILGFYSEAFLSLLLVHSRKGAISSDAMVILRGTGADMSRRTSHSYAQFLLRISCCRHHGQIAVALAATRTAMRGNIS